MPLEYIRCILRKITVKYNDKTNNLDSIPKLQLLLDIHGHTDLGLPVLELSINIIHVIVTS